MTTDDDKTHWTDNYYLRRFGYTKYQYEQKEMIK